MSNKQGEFSLNVSNVDYVTVPVSVICSSKILHVVIKFGCWPFYWHLFVSSVLRRQIIYLSVRNDCYPLNDIICITVTSLVTYDNWHEQ